MKETWLSGLQTSLENENPIIVVEININAATDVLEITDQRKEWHSDSSAAAKGQ